MTSANKVNFDNTKEFKKQLDTVSPAFCTAKWLQSTILLYNGETHSCHHPSRHKIPTEGLDENPKLLHNTPIKIFARKEMIEGIQTAECEYCWRIENSNNENLSDRVYKSASPWAKPYFDDVVNSGLGEDSAPSYLEVAFESTCNFACMYCTPEVSTAWMAEVEKHSHYTLHTTTMHSAEWLKKIGKYPIHRDDYNPYIEAFWKWWPELYPKLDTFRITGGEPLLSKHTWKIFDYIKENPNPKMEFAINTNLNVPRKLIDRLVDEISQVADKVKEVKLYTSLEATGKDAEYIRYGMVYPEFMENLDYVMTKLPNVRIVLMVTANALSMFTFNDFLNQIIRLRAKHFKDASHSTLGFNVSYLRWPQFQDVRILPNDIKARATKEVMEVVDAHREKKEGFGEAMFYLEEIDQVERFLNYMEQDLPNKENMLKDFKMYFNEYDRRRNLDFKATFPEIAFLVE